MRNYARNICGLCVIYVEYVRMMDICDEYMLRSSETEKCPVTQKET